MNFSRKLQGYLAILPNIRVKKLLKKIFHKATHLQRQIRDQWLPTYDISLSFPLTRLYSYLKEISIDNNYLTGYPIFALADYYMDHRFDLLGSGWVKVGYGMDCRGLEEFCYRMGATLQSDPEGHWLEGRINRSNIRESKRIWGLIDHDYIPIDWYLDFKSGYRWTERTYYKNILYGHRPGVDVKVPWELSRMQHLPQLALAYGFARQQGKKDLTASYCREFRNQILDFIAATPPRYGVNWHCTMDVAIRAANWLMAFDLFRSFGAEFDQPFEAVFIRSLYEHGSHIVENLEWSPGLRSNHYLSDIVGLLFIAAYLPCAELTNAWLALAVQELIAEVHTEFNKDGTNFEASTSYHRLSAELVIYATALIIGFPEEKKKALKDYNHKIFQANPKLKPAPMQSFSFMESEITSPFPEWYFERLEKMAEFTMHITKDNGCIPQIGDNDSGRFLKLQPAYASMSVKEAKAYYKNLENYSDLPDDVTYLDENCLDQRHLVAAINGLFGRDDFTAFTGLDYLETDIIRHLSRNIKIPSYLQAQKSSLTEAERYYVIMKDDWLRLNQDRPLLPKEQHEVKELFFPGDNLLDGIRIYSYPDFGLFVYRSKRLYLAVRCGAIGQNGNGGHAHNDQLAIELNVDGRDVISDPGTYLYTPLPARRNRYRSVKVHFSPQLVDQEPAGFNQGLFRLAGGEDGKSICLGENGFVGIYRNIKIFILIYADKIVLEASSSQGKPGWVHEQVQYSEGYGKLRRW